MIASITINQEWLQLFLAYSFFCALTLAIFCAFILRFTLDRRVRKALPKDKEYNAFPDWYFGMGRAISFGSACVFERAKKSNYMQNFYDGFDVKDFASPFEKVIAWSMVLSVGIVVLLIFINIITNSLGLWS